jgi:hypothetical protein
MKRLAALGVVVTAWLALSVPAAQADIGGNVPGPGICDYPGIGHTGNVQGANYFWCDFPTEENGAHWHCEYAGWTLGGAGFSTRTNAGLSGLSDVGAVAGSCSFRCADGSLAATPNPPGAWKNALTPKNCVPLAVAPVSEPNTGLPPYAGQLPVVTNPGTPNPVTTSNG